MLKECCAYLFVLPSTSYLLTSLLLALPTDKCGKWLCPSTGQLTNLSTKKVNGMTWRLTCQLVYSGFVLFPHEFSHCRLRSATFTHYLFLHQNQPSQELIFCDRVGGWWTGRELIMFNPLLKMDEMTIPYNTCA